ncbi:MAG: hypothetical protein K5669_03435 [Lachnospiraceae bacterium]|nr:hypothetical protein [Lachnospiraceae bacterium]
MSEILLIILFNALMLGAAITDLIYKEVYDLFWLFQIGIIMTSAFINKAEVDAGIVTSLLIYFIIQEFVMDKAYGKADCHAFCCSALFFSYFGLELETYVLHISIVFVLIVIKAVMDGNISATLNLKKPIPMIPYILVGSWAVFAIYVP